MFTLFSPTLSLPWWLPSLFAIQIPDSVSSLICLFVATYADIPFEPDNLLNISYKILAFPIMQMGKFCPRYVRSFDLNHYSYISLPCNTSFSSFQGILLKRTLVRHVLKIDLQNTVMYICISWLKSELRCSGKFLCSISGSSALRSSHLVFIVENRLYNK